MYNTEANGEEGHATLEEDHATLEHILIFFAGCKEIPPTGFSEKPTLLFDGEMVLPEASTCLLKLWLPTKHKDYPTFKKMVH